MNMLQQMFRCHCIEKFKNFVLMYGLLGKLWILIGVLLPYLYIAQIHVFSIGQKNNGCSKKFKLINGTKLKLQKGHEIVFWLFYCIFHKN